MFLKVVKVRWIRIMDIGCKTIYAPKPINLHFQGPGSLKRPENEHDQELDVGLLYRMASGTMRKSIHLLLHAGNHFTRGKTRARMLVTPQEETHTSFHSKAHKKHVWSFLAQRFWLAVQKPEQEVSRHLNEGSRTMVRTLTYCTEWPQVTLRSGPFHWSC